MMREIVEVALACFLIFVAASAGLAVGLVLFRFIAGEPF